MYRDESVGELYRQLDPADMLYDYLIGSTIGLFGSGANIATGQNAEANRALREIDAAEAAYLRRMEEIGHLRPEGKETAALEGAADDVQEGKEQKHCDLQHATKETLKEDPLALHTYHDPMREKMGSAFQSHPKEISKIIKSLKARGVEVVSRPGSMSYSPDCRGGRPGKLIMDPEASYSAWLHELQHLADDEASGWQGMKILSIPLKALEFETAAYRVEIDFARKNGYSKIARRLERLLFERRQEILGTQKNNKQPHE